MEKWSIEDFKEMERKRFKQFLINVFILMVWWAISVIIFNLLT